MSLWIIKGSDFADALKHAFREHDKTNLKYLMTEFNIADHGVTKRQKRKSLAAALRQAIPAKPPKYSCQAVVPKQKNPLALVRKRKLNVTPILFFLVSCTTQLSATESEIRTDEPSGSTRQQEHLGLFPAENFRVTTGKCNDCPTPKQARWYFENDLIAVPKKGLPVAGLATERDGYDEVMRALRNRSSEKALRYPSTVWIGSKNLLEHATLSGDGKKLTTSDGNEFALTLVPKLATNRSYYDPSSVEFFGQRSVRLRGSLKQDGATTNLLARTIWPEDFRIRKDALINQPLPRGESFSRLITSGDAQAPFETRLLWENSAADGRNWAGRPVLGLVLSGGQGDDDESQAGHLAVVTGRVGTKGEIADWLVSNFYNLDEVSEKGIIASMLPLDNYLMDLNSGQSYYRPTYLLVAVLKDPRAAMSFQAAIEPVYNHFYRHDFLYHHSKINCTGISIDTLRAIGWRIPRQGATGYLKAAAAFAYLSVTDRSLASGKKMFDYLSEERTRLFPRAAFETAAEDWLAILDGQAARPERRLTDYELALRDDAEAVLFIRIPQIPSSRAFGTYPVASFDEYRARVPADRSKWKIVPVDPRPFPEALREPLLAQGHAIKWTAATILTVALVLLGAAGRLRLRRRVGK